MPHLIANLPCETFALRVGAQPLLLWRPENAEKMVLETTPEQFGEDERLPYWAILWPASIALAEFLEDCVDLDGKRVMELGAGLALPGLVAARAGAQVVVSDWFEEPLAFAQASARLNGVHLVTMSLDWRNPPAMEPFDLVVGADLLYERRSHAPVLDCLEALLVPEGTAILADPCRHMTPSFIEMAVARGWDCHSHRVAQAFEGATYEVDCWVMRRK